MKMKTTKTNRVMMIIIFSLLISHCAKGNLLVNGSFESGINTSWGFVTIASPGTDITGWTVTGANIDYINTYWQASDGRKSLDLNGTPGVGGICQSFSTVAGQLYQVQFDQAANTDIGARISYMGIKAAGQSAQFTFDCTGYSRGNMGWVSHVWQFTAVDTTTTLQFYSLDTKTIAYGPALDNVVVTAVPEPATMSLLSLGSLFFLKRRK